MPSDVLQELKNYFGRDFLLGVFFPVLIFISINLTLYFEITLGLPAALAAWEKLSLVSQVLLVLGALAAILVLSYLIFNFQYSIIRLFEGYWPRWRFLNMILNWRISIHSRRWDYLKKVEQSESTSREEKKKAILEQFSLYPPPRPQYLDAVMPTQIGAILRNSELYADDHYGIDSVIIWTRLYPLLPNEIIAPLIENKMAMDFMLLMSTFSVAFTLFWCPVLAIFTNRWDLFLLCALGWPIAWICYRNAVQSAFAYGERVKVAFDLHRNDLLPALGRKIPKDAFEERKEWERLSKFFKWSILPRPSPPEPDKAQSLDEIVKALVEYLKKVNPPTT